LEATWNSNCDSTLHQVQKYKAKQSKKVFDEGAGGKLYAQTANTQTRH